MPLAALGPIEIQQVRRTADEPLFNSLMEQYHYLGYEQPVGEHLKYLVWAQGQADGVSGVEFGAAASGEPRPLHRLGQRGAAAQRPLPRLQHALSDSAVGRGPAPGLAHSGPHGAVRSRRIGSASTGIRSIVWKPSSTRNGFAGPVIARRTGWCWGAPRAGAKTIRHIGRTGRSKKCSGCQLPGGFASYCSKSK